MIFSLLTTELTTIYTLLVSPQNNILLALFLCATAASRNYTSVQPGSNSGLNLILHVNQNDYLYTPSASAGFRVNERLYSCEICDL